MALSADLQDELELLRSVYPEEMTEQSSSLPLVLSFKFVEEETAKLGRRELGLQVTVQGDYPTTPATCVMTIPADAMIQERVNTAVQEEADRLTGEAMIYQLIEYVKEHLDDLGVPRDDTAAQKTAKSEAAKRSLWDELQDRKKTGAPAPVMEEITGGNVLILPVSASATTAAGSSSAPAPAPATAAAAAAVASDAHRSKAAKRNALKYVEATGEKPRGWNWIEVVSHLRKTGGTDADEDAA